LLELELDGYGILIDVDSEMGRQKSAVDGSCDGWNVFLTVS